MSEIECNHWFPWNSVYMRVCVCGGKRQTEKKGLFSMHSLPVGYSCLFNIPYFDSSFPGMKGQLQAGWGGSLL